MLSNVESVAELATEQVVETVSNSESITELTDRLDDILKMLESINGFLYRINQYADYIVAFAVVILLCLLYYKFIGYFTRF